MCSLSLPRAISFAKRPIDLVGMLLIPCKNKVWSMEVLPQDIMSQIFSHVPAEFILNCKLVCKTWKILLLSRKVGKMGLLFTLSAGANKKALYYGDYEEILGLDNDQSVSFKTLTKKVNHPPFKPGHGDGSERIMIGSCNGLVCFSIPHHGIHDPVYICNPYTREYVNLPRLPIVRRQGAVVVSGFGYLPATNEYKVIRICYPSLRGDGYVQIYTLGNDKGWRNIGEIKRRLWLPGVVADGTLYFIDDYKREILAFHLAEEEFQLVPSPECISNYEGHADDVRYQIRVIKGCLCVAHELSTCEQIDIWSFKSNELDNCNGKKDYKSWRWCKEYSVPWFSDINPIMDFYELFRVTKSNEVLMWVSSTAGMALYCFNPETGSATWISDSNFTDLKHFQAIPHVNTIVSLKSLGVRSKRTITLAEYSHSHTYATRGSKRRRIKLREDNRDSSG